MKFEWPWQRKRRKQQERLDRFRQISSALEPLKIYPEADVSSPLHPSNPLYPLNVIPATTEEVKKEPNVLPFNPVRWDDTPVERVTSSSDEIVHTYSAPEDDKTSYSSNDSYSSSDSSSSSSSDSSSY